MAIALMGEMTTVAKVIDPRVHILINSFQQARFDILRNESHFIRDRIQYSKSINSFYLIGYRREVRTAYIAV